MPFTGEKVVSEGETASLQSWTRSGSTTASSSPALTCLSQEPLWDAESLSLPEAAASDDSDESDDEEAVRRLALAVRGYSLQSARCCPPCQRARKPAKQPEPLVQCSSESEDEEGLEGLTLSVRRWALAGARSDAQ
eukprot:gb/GFBE01022036.1/.p1 GENE.gb/GFBE01022036.1/~~gb/GFBE01022036.1/.p1  ORF type:complete len:136 (+),score=26.73 gb/GFBE01022036.1/:1-408(+)